MSEQFPDPDFPPDEAEPPVIPVEPGEPGVVVDGWTDAPVAGDRVDVHTEAVIAGDPGGARVELSAEAFHDPLRGTVGPGIKIVPEDTIDTDIAPGMGPTDRGLIISGGTDQTGAPSTMKLSPTEVRTSWYRGGDGALIVANAQRLNLQSYKGSGDSASIQIDPGHTAMTSRSTSTGTSGDIATSTVDADVRFYEGSTVTGRIKASSGTASIETVRPNGDENRFTVDSSGIRVRTKRSGVWTDTSLETLGDRLAAIEARLDAAGL